MIISPSVLSCDFSVLAKETREVLDAGAEWVHIDVMDGHFVPNITLGAPVLASLSKSVPAFYDVHLMISDPLFYAEAFAKAGADLITFHVEADSDVKKTIEKMRSLGVKCGVSVKPKTPAEAVFEYLPDVDMVLVMTVEPGFGGQSFMEDMCPKISAIRREAERIGRPDFLIEVDGGINENTAKKVAAAGANVLVAGSAIYAKQDRAAAIAALRAE